MALEGDTGLRTPSAYKVRRPCRSEDIMHFQVSALADLVTLTFDRETSAHYCTWGGQSSYQFWCL